MIQHPTNKMGSGNVTLTMTTCKRLDLFLETVDTLRKCVKDLDQHIKEWIIVDDNSSMQDRTIMQQKCPWARFIMKTPFQKGHVHSMNIILKQVDTPYVLHVEDDWSFFRAGNFIQYALDIFEAEPQCGQVLFNDNYVELPDEHGLIPTIGQLKATSSGYVYRVHGFEPGGHVGGNSYWPHFSLRPGLWNMDRMRKVGWFNTAAPHFEQEFALRYFYQHRLVTSFFPFVVCKHIGKHTSDKVTPNAYTLNDEPQFTGSAHTAIDARVINLERRPDRLATFTEHTKNSIYPVKVHKAVDGIDYTLSSAEDELWFKGNDYGYARGMVACALSHLQLLKEHSQRTDPVQVMAVFEDDCLVPNGCELLDEALFLVGRLLASGAFDYVFLTTQTYRHEQTATNNNQISVRVFPQPFNTYTLGGTAAYMISRRGAQRLLDYLSQQKLIHCIDTMMLKAGSTLRVGVLYPSRHVCDSPIPLTESADTDIQGAQNLFPIKREELTP